jgi:hypothetical protein
LVVGFLALGWQHEDCAGLAELVLGLLPVIAGLLLVIAGLGVPFHGCIAFSSMAPPGIEGRPAGPACIRVVNFLFAMPPAPPVSVSFFSLAVVDDRPNKRKKELPTSLMRDLAYRPAQKIHDGRCTGSSRGSTRDWIGGVPKPDASRPQRRSRSRPAARRRCSWPRARRRRVTFPG